MHSTYRSTRAPRQAFTLLELLVVLALIILLIGLTWIAVGAVQGQARTTSCQSNQRQINLANFGFAADNKGIFMSPRSDPNFNPNAECASGGEEYRLFTKSFGNRIGTVSGSRTEFDEALTDGAAWAYLGDLKIYSSPLDPTNRLRSYAINAYVGEICPDNLPIDGYEAMGAGWRAARTLSGLPKPNSTIMTICEEDHHGGQPIDIADFNNQGWVVKSWDAPLEAWWDYPAPWLEEGVTLSFCDGSTSFYRFKTPNLGQVLIDNSASGFGHHRATYEGEPGQGTYGEHNSDRRWFANHMLPGVITN